MKDVRNVQMKDERAAVSVKEGAESFLAEVQFTSPSGSGIISTLFIIFLFCFLSAAPFLKNDTE